MSNAAAVEVTLAALELGPEHQALEVAARSLAEAVDDNPDNASLWREYRQALATLDEVAPTTDVDTFGELRDVLEGRGNAEVRD